MQQTGRKYFQNTQLIKDRIQNIQRTSETNKKRKIHIKNWGNDLNRDLTEAQVQLVNTHERCSTI